MPTSRVIITSADVAKDWRIASSSLRGISIGSYGHDAGIVMYGRRKPSSRRLFTGQLRRASEGPVNETRSRRRGTGVHELITNRFLRRSRVHHRDLKYASI